MAWKTSSELKSDYYKIQRTTDKKNFIDIARVNPTSKADPDSIYRFIDNRMIDGMNYYRIKAVHENGSKTYSKIISIKTKNNGPISISKTNVPGIFLVKSEDVYSAPYLAYNILNSAGIVVHKGRIENAHGKINTTIYHSCNPEFIM